jgi:hypothetical protein
MASIYFNQLMFDPRFPFPSHSHSHTPHPAYHR